MRVAECRQAHLLLGHRACAAHASLEQAENRGQRGCAARGPLALGHLGMTARGARVRGSLLLGGHPYRRRCRSRSLRGHRGGCCPRPVGVPRSTHARRAVWGTDLGLAAGAGGTHLRRVMPVARVRMAEGVHAVRRGVHCRHRGAMRAGRVFGSDRVARNGANPSWRAQALARIGKRETCLQLTKKNRHRLFFGADAGGGEQSRGARRGVVVGAAQGIFLSSDSQ
eukprot:scaffold1825_cov112-Isochrysis_galbana.AAC.2